MRRYIENKSISINGSIQYKWNSKMPYYIDEISLFPNKASKIIIYESDEFFQKKREIIGEIIHKEWIHLILKGNDIY